ncbi:MULTISPECIES: hypothetical protein [unclassified Mesorhizobium]|uniref:hypothetical protein n=1 Tax=unclassified Mesorhizobium TaxID=325217 RepID=UPI0033381840
MSSLILKPREAYLKDRYGVTGQRSPIRVQPSTANGKAEGGAIQKMLAFIVIGFAAWALLKACSLDRQSTPDVAAVNMPVDGLQCFSGWDGSSGELVRMVTGRLRDPDSFQHSETKTSKPDKSGHPTVLMEYRAKNGFGGYTVGYATGSLNISDCTVTNFSLVGQ